ncbi:MAG: hypothetical protein M3Y48_21575 [Actinomycetota bacterium]|nr:hypothetical protein [Actinomycetota bacterium]
MIIQLESATAENVEASRRNLEALAHSWGHEMIKAPASTPDAAAAAGNDDKVIDPVSLAALVLSIPSAALAVLDLADRIHKRRRAKELIDHAQQLAAQHVTVCLISHSRPVELTTLAPDQLLDLLADET